MSKRKWLSKAASPPVPKTSIIDPQAAKLLDIIFGFKYLDLSSKPFDCSERHGAGLLYCFNTFRLFSSMKIDQALSYKNCHKVPDDQIRTEKLQALKNQSHNKLLYQLGRNQTPERIVGYFDYPQVNLFQVGFLDLKHRLSGD